MKKISNIILAAAALTATGASAQTGVTFDSDDYAAVGVYDTWPESPFRTGTLRGNVKVVANHLADPVANPSARILGIQRSMAGSNTFGARIDLSEPFELTPEMKYVHVLIHKPVEGRVMLIGLGKRFDRPDQTGDEEQFWVFPQSEVRAGEWCDAVFPVKGNGGIAIGSLVVVPHCEDPRTAGTDFAAYIDEIEITDSDAPRFSLADKAASSAASAAADGTVAVTQDNRNGEIRLVATGRAINNDRVAARRPLAIEMHPSNGFVHRGIRVRRSDGADTVFDETHFDGKGRFTIPAEVIDGDIVIEGLFVEKPKK